MKKRTIWIIACAMGISFAALIFMQVFYFNKIVEMRQRQFDENVKRALYQAVHSIELKETQTTIEKEIAANDSTHRDQLRTEMEGLQPAPPALPLDPDGISPKIGMGLQRPNTAIADRVRERFINQKNLLNEVIYSTLYHPVDIPFERRINRNDLDNALKTELQHNGIDLKQVAYHFQVLTIDGREVARCPDYEEGFGDAVYKQPIFPNDPPSQSGFVVVRFPHVGNYIYESARFVLPAIIFTFILLVMFIFTIFTIFRQRKLSEIKNDFINNMTHEFKTPIASINLAAQMLSDRNIEKSEERIAHLSRIITDESKRLKFHVEKVLQMSAFDRSDTATLKFQELEANTVIEDVVATFRLQVENVHGTIESHIDAEDPIVQADPMHFTNLIYNLLENALKYRKPDVPLELHVATYNKDNQLCISFKDNGIGIRRENLKHIFERFYRVPTGNVHNVKGVGIGLAYVASVVKAHKGTIHVDSNYGIGTTFTISLPLLDA